MSCPNCAHSPSLHRFDGGCAKVGCVCKFTHDQAKGIPTPKGWPKRKDEGTPSESWNVIQDEVRISRIPRVNWKALLGMALTKFCIVRYERGLKPKDIIDEVQILLPNLNDKAILNLADCAHARFAEWNQRNNILRELGKK